ncbi:MAG TPA: RDD family protein, partial [Acidimicrobiia bacterium]
VDDIRGAYRVRKDGLDTASDAGKADAAKLNKAWNVLSDPYQRGRYDAQRTAAEASDELGSDDADDQAASSSNGSGPKGLRGNARNSRQERQRSVRDARAERLKKAATIAAPAGTHFPKPKQRIIAMVIDLLVLIVLVSGSQVAAQAIAKSQKPAIVKQVNALNDQITAENKVKSDADTAVGNDKKVNNTAKQAVDQKASDDAKAQVTALTKQRDDAASKLNPYFLGALVAAFFLGFLYLAIPSAITGRTLGKRLQHLKTLREDGSPLGARGAIIRFGLLVLVTFTLYLLLQQFAAILVLFGVTMWLRNANMQGLHDRFAHTIVVSDAAD